ncbi:beta-ketoacyl-ACP synthase III [Apilactobacillus xinyiensis]|jgi:3-oxoacyl-[acyl-carrier-protein] synthase-3|uniref:Beta-ketoacyl-[acyl-carrier-protein] synthase III n=1 Tax=Apilactobacillus xinyiensis TaxID=2841032 RepID=A0ABT0I179_9LACO|nr:beta-ketoacyl-ACP synthase III [Apilactobacillus xinyiensis]MCK8624491.1 ketoacyl-ACP synthase III [Apilactobacillus xinyiensis]MCL0312086.1 ketoacyl-ACP synthase III [Apilactobacillus xinyiensis]MCL0318642.1 ketoacyl-ACP synthase III [Apilactobacillus xinyiensis]MCL0330422.1 ketoacyl-ACP synthase III [Apilactobacillus xinyiensis]
MSGFSILSTAKAVPKKVVTNDDLAKIMDTSDEWITRRTGIKTRHIANDETTTSLCTNVAENLLQRAGVDASEIDFIIVGTMSSDYQTPSTAASVQGLIGATNAVAFDINAACSGFVFGLDILNSLLNRDVESKGILIGGETLSKMIDWNDRSTAVLFGDGAGGVLVSNQGSGEILSKDLKTYGEKGHSLTAGHISKTDENADIYFHMDGRAVYDFATHSVPESIKRAAESAKIDLQDIDYFVLHQANARIIKSVSRKLGISIERFPININQYGNTAAASEPILLEELTQHGTIARGNIVALSGFGGGLTTGTVILKY